MTISALTLPLSSVALATRLSAQADAAAMTLAIYRDSIPDGVRGDIEALLSSAEALAAQVTAAEAYRALGAEIDEAERVIRGQMGRGLGGAVMIAEMRAAQERLNPMTATADVVATARATVAATRAMAYAG